MEPIFNYKVDRIVNRAVLIFCFVMLSLALYNTITWRDSPKNPINEEFVNEVAFNLGIDPSQVTYRQFQKRYNK